MNFGFIRLLLLSQGFKNRRRNLFFQSGKSLYGSKNILNATSIFGVYVFCN